MELYAEVGQSSASWSAPLEPIYQSLGCGYRSELTPKLPHLSESDALFLGALVRMPRESRPHGIITWASHAFDVSHKSIYALGERIEKRLLGSQEGPSIQQASPSRAECLSPSVEVTGERLNRVILRSMFPGNASIRPTQEILEEAVDVSRSVGYTAHGHKFNFLLV